MKYLPVIFSLGLIQVSLADLDMNGNGVSEVWELIHPEISLTDADNDSDGRSNLEEAIAGTDPEDAASYLTLSVEVIDAQSVRVYWQASGGKNYSIEKLGDTGWESLLSFLPRGFDSEREAVLPNESEMLFRVVAGDVDLDGDGLTAWEEVQLGWSDQNSMSSGDPTRMDFPAAVRRLESVDGATLIGGQDLEAIRPSEAEASRFLMQATFGPTIEEIEEVVSLGYSGWLDQQLAMVPSRSATTMWRTGQRYSATLWKDSWWQLAVRSPDQLRQRMAYSLSQIFVVGFQGGNWVGDNPLVQAAYYDQFVDCAFGDYRDLLEDVTYSSVMGFYLSSLKNRKSDPAIGRFPDENFAREIMQLFSIGLWELNPDGSRKVDSQGADIPTYDNSTITEMAKVFTGLSYSKNGTNNEELTFTSGVGGNAFLHPMKVFEVEHEPGPKHLLQGVVLNDTDADGEALTGEEEIQATLDLLSGHPNTAPFISNLLIQRFTSSNPTPDYLRRVSESWMLNGAQEGVFERVMEAILLDPEVRGEIVLDTGKVREPVIRLTQLLRAFNFANRADKVVFYSPQIDQDFGQHPMLSPSVFNFYLPSYRPQGELEMNGLASPEMQLATTVQHVTSDNSLRALIEGVSVTVNGDFEPLMEIAEDSSALVDYLELLFSSRPFQDATRQNLIQIIEQQTSLKNRVLTAVHHVVTSPEATVLK